MVALYRKTSPLSQKIRISSALLQVESYWGGATGHTNMRACGVVNSCRGGKKCNCDYQTTTIGWREDSGLLTDKTSLPVTQIRLGDLDQSHEEGYHTLGKLKCYGQAS